MNSTAFVALYFYERLILDPLVEFVDCDKDVFKTTFGFLSGPTWSSPQHANGQAGGMQISS
jgi:hypothetical protein